jgi:hypothetical protein
MQGVSSNFPRDDASMMGDKKAKMGHVPTCSLKDVLRPRSVTSLFIFVLALAQNTNFECFYLHSIVLFYFALFF